MLSAASATQTSANLTLDPTVATGTVTTAIDRYRHSELNNGTSSYYKASSPYSRALPIVTAPKAVLTGLNQAAKQVFSPSPLAFEERGTTLGWSLTPGTYSVQVDASSSESSLASDLPTPQMAEPGHTLATASSLSTVNNPQTVNGFVSNTVTDSYYRLTLDVTSNLNLSLSGLTADADLQLLQDTNNNGIVDGGEVLAGSSQPDVQPESIAIGLAAGTYFIRVYQYSGDTSYTLSAASTPILQPIGYSSTYGYGLVNAGAAIDKAIGQSPTAAVLSTDSNAWELNLVNAPTAWTQGYTGQGVVVAVVDTGVDSTHLDLKDNIWTNPGEIAGNGIDDDKNGFIDDVNGWDFVDRDNTPTDLVGHGTHVAGTIAAERNDFGVTGVAYNAKIMPVRVIGSNGGGNLDVAAGIRYAADNGADVINLSLGGSASSAITDAVQYAFQKGSLVVMAAGNDGGNQPTFPGNLANQWGIAVGAIDINQTLATFSDRAGAIPLNYVVAPGVNVISTTPNNTYQSYSGTSMATPHVSGVAALLLSASPTLTPTQLISLLATDATAQSLTVA